MFRLILRTFWAIQANEGLSTRALKDMACGAIIKDIKSRKNAYGHVFKEKLRNILENTLKISTSKHLINV